LKRVQTNRKKFTIFKKLGGLEELGGFDARRLNVKML
jgi:hypothetical protein